MRNLTRPQIQRATIEELTASGFGIANVNGRKIYLANALPGEDVEFLYLHRQRNGDTGIALQVIANAHPDRVMPRCPQNGYCGGCSLQHLSYAAQIKLQQNYLAECLAPCGGPENWRTPIPQLINVQHLYGYRRKARLGVKWVEKRASLFIGFRERGRSLIAEINSCPILHPAVGERISELRALVNSCDARKIIPQIEIAVGTDQVAFIFRHTAELNMRDRQLLISFAAAPNLVTPEMTTQIFLQAGGLDTITQLWPETPTPLSYYLPNYELSFLFQPTDFIQVNAAVNNLMVDQALDLLQLTPQDTGLDLYCGLGNFTLPMARLGALIIGVEGDPELVKRARANAQRNNLAPEFYAHDLCNGLPRTLFSDAITNLKVLLDPPRTGALEIIADLAALHPTRIVYISCNPITLGRDALELTRRYDYRLETAGVIDMFPHTGHIESLAVFSK